MRWLHSTAVASAILATTILTTAVAAGRAAESKTYVKRTEHEFRLGNAAVELGFVLTDTHCGLDWLDNRLAGRRLPDFDDNFSIGIEGRKPLTADDFTFRKADDEALPGGRRLVLHFDGRTPGTALDVIYELGDADFFVRRRLELATDKPLALRQVDVWVGKIAGECIGQGFGQPVLLDDTFWGLEFPAGHNAFAQDKAALRLTQFPGRTVTGKFVSKTAVVGVAEKGRVVERFRRYVETFQATPRDRHLFVNYNTWWTLMPPTEENCLALIETFRSKLYAPYGESFDTFTIDDGWDNKDSLWKIRTDRFPRGFTPLVDELKKMNAELGLWLSPSSGYSHAPWGAKNGYEHNSNPWFLCQSGPKYRRDIVPVVTGLGRRYDMAFFKFDGFSATCEATGHGHLAGDYAREANVDAYIELLSAVRKVRPDVFLDPTCGMWLSPWWLEYADSIWGSVSGDYPAIVVPAPVIRDSATGTRDAIFRQRCREHPGYPPAAIEHLGVIVITPEKWEDNAMIVLGRGCRLLTLYINPEFFKRPDRDWAFLASMLKWVRHNAATLAHTELILGDPMKREPYGYAHFAGDRGIVALRNPFIEPRKVAVKLDETSGWKKPASKGGEGRPSRYVARIVYPRHLVLPGRLAHGDALDLELQGYETVIVQIDPAVAGEPEMQKPYREVKREGKQLLVELRGGAGEDRLSSVEGGKLEAATVDGAWRISGTCTAIVPKGTKAAMHVLFDPGGLGPGAPKCTALVDGKDVPMRAVRSPEKPQQAHVKHSWTWFSFDLPEGKSRVDVAIGPGKGGDASGRFLRGEVGWWLWAEHPLVKYTLAMDLDAPLPPAPNDPLPLPIAQDRQRQIVTIVPATPMRAGNRWPKLDRATVFLDEAPPDEVDQDWGKVQLNQSVWQKPMIVAGRKFTRGLGTHADACLEFDLDGGKFKKFRALVGRDEHAMDGQVIFEVWVDGKKRFDSGPMLKATPAKQIDVDVTGAKTLELRTLDGGDGISGDHGNWAEAQLVR